MQQQAVCAAAISFPRIIFHNALHWQADDKARTQRFCVSGNVQIVDILGPGEANLTHLYKPQWAPPGTISASWEKQP
jgi:hypothetical protein